MSELVCECRKVGLCLPFFPIHSSQISVGWPNSTHLSPSRSLPFENMTWERSEGVMIKRMREECKEDLGEKEGALRSLFEGANEQRTGGM